MDVAWRVGWMIFVHIFGNFLLDGRWFGVKVELNSECWSTLPNRLSLAETGAKTPWIWRFYFFFLGRGEANGPDLKLSWDLSYEHRRTCLIASVLRLRSRTSIFTPLVWGFLSFVASPQPFPGNLDCGMGVVLFFLFFFFQISRCLNPAAGFDRSQICF